MKKEYKNKLIEIGGYCTCLIVILAIGYFSGYLKGFAPDDFVNAYEQITADLSKSSAVKNTNVSFSRTKSIGSKTTSTYNDYQAARIPVAVIRGVNTSGTWTEIFNSHNKTVFYLYDKQDDSFDSSIKNFVNNGVLSSKYTVYSYGKDDFSNLRLGEVGPSKICNSLQECNQVRQKASDYSTMAEFLKYCGKTMCIINPSKGEYVRVKTRNSAIKMLDDLQNW